MPDTILIVGSTGTIGSALVTEFSQSHVVIGASRSGEQRVDLTDVDSIEGLVSRLRESHRSLAGVLCAAGGGLVAPLGEMNMTDALSAFSAKLVGQMALVRFASQLVRPGGAIVLTSGILAKQPMAKMSHLSTINAALEGFVRAAAIECAPVRVCCVSPGLVNESSPAVLALFDGMPRIGAAELARVYRDVFENGESGLTRDAF